MTLLVGHKNSQKRVKGLYLIFWLTGSVFICSGSRGLKVVGLEGFSALWFASLLLYSCPIGLGISSVLGRSLSPLPFGGVGLEMLILHLGLVRFQEAKFL